MAIVHRVTQPCSFPEVITSIGKGQQWRRNHVLWMAALLDLTQLHSSVAFVPVQPINRHHQDIRYFNVRSTSPAPDSSFRRYPMSLRSTASEDEVDTTEFNADRTLGVLVLLTVPLAWGTYSPVVRYLYEIQPPVPGFVFSAAYYMVASLSLTVLSMMQKVNIRKSTKKDDPEGYSNGLEAFPILSGIELGMYLFIGNALQVIGLRTVPADRAGFLVQLTTVMVPLVQGGLIGNVMSISVQIWVACIVAFAGVIVMGMDGVDVVDSGMLSSLSAVIDSFTQGDLLIVLAAFAYTLHVVRLGKYAKESTPLKLAASKATIEAILSACLVSLLMAVGASVENGTGLLGYAQETGREISTFFSAISNGIVTGAVPSSALLLALGAVMWTGWVTCAYTIYAQSFGQRRVSPVSANLIYTLQPIFTALFAWGLLGETLGPKGFVGAGLIGSAVYLVALSRQEGNEVAAEEG